MSAREILAAASAAGLSLAMATNSALATCDVVMDFEILAEAGVGFVNVGTTYMEDGFTVNDIGPEPERLASWRLHDLGFAGSTGMFQNEFGGGIELVKQGGGAFRLASIDLASSNNLGATSATFIGERDGMQVAMQTFTTTAVQAFQTFVFNADFANVDRVTWISTFGPMDFHQFDDIVLTRAMTTVVDFESLEQAGGGSFPVDSPYSEDGFDVGGISLRSFRLDGSRFAGSTGLFDAALGSQNELTKQGGGAFRLAAIDLSPLNNAGTATTVTFTGELDGSPVATQMFTTTTTQVFQSFNFNEDFKHVDRVTWVQEFTPDTHQFDDIVLGDAVATILESATLGATGQMTGPFASDQFLGNRFSLSESTRVTEIGGHIVVDSGSIWGAIIPLSGPNALPPFGFDVEANALAHALFEFTDGLSADLCQAVDVILPRGDYALCFGGGGLFGSTGIGNLPQGNPETPQANYFFRRSNDGMWVEGGHFQTRFIVRGTPIPCSNCPGDADGSGVVNFGDVTNVLGNWLTVCPTDDETVFESATLGATGQGGGISVSANQFLGVRFSLNEPTTISGIGGHMGVFGGTIWGAIIPLSAPGALPPNGLDIEAEAIASALFDSTGGGMSEDLVESVDVTLLTAGDYAIVFGAGGLFGSTGEGTMPANNTEIGAPSYFFTGSSGAVWQDGGIFQVRFVVAGDGLCATCDGDADFSGVVNFADVTTVLGNWLAVCP